MTALIEREHQEIPESKEYYIIKKFKSKENSVYLVHNNQENGKKVFILKQYSRPFKKMAREKYLLQRLKREGVNVPDLLKVEEESILLEYINGPLLIDILSEQEKLAGSESSCLTLTVFSIINSLSAWLKDFYTATQRIAGKQLILGDISFRNFIFTDKLYGIDFEECRKGVIEEDVGRICTFALTCEPAFTTWKLALVSAVINELIVNLSLNEERIKREIKKQLITLVPLKENPMNRYVDLLVSNLLKQGLFEKEICQ